MFASIITCIYNQDISLFKECVSSISAIQSELDFEWIVVDDGSTEERSNSYRKLINKSTFNKNMSVEYFQKEENKGLSIARNTGLKNARGDFIIILDSDDIIVPGILEFILLNKTKKLFCFEVNYFERGYQEYRSLDFFAKSYKEYGNTEFCPFLWFDFYYHGIIAHSSLFKSHGDYRENLPVGEDQEILIRFAHALNKDEILFSRNLGYNYRINPKSVCATRWDEVKSGYQETMLEHMKKKNNSYNECRFSRVIKIDSANIDYYEYHKMNYGWVDWFKAVGKNFNTIM